MVEKWKPIKGYEGLYEISNLGSVKNVVKNSIKMPYLSKKDISGLSFGRTIKGKSILCIG